jgi:hypothetical protein
VFRRHLWPLPEVRSHILGTYRHVIADNIEEDTPFAHDLLRDLLPELDSALLIYDQDAGYRQFLGADPRNAYALHTLCQHQVTFHQSFVTSPALQALGSHLAQALEQPVPAGTPANTPPQQASAGDALHFTESLRFYPQMLDWISAEIAALVEDGTPPGEIVVLAPFLSDALRFSLMNRLERLRIPVRSHRPSRALRDEPATHALLTLATLAHPHWRADPGPFDVANALLQGVDDLDLVRAHLLAQIVHRPKDGRPQLSSWEKINPDMRERISYVLGGRFDTIRLWLSDYARKPEQPLDHFLSRLFGEILSQRGFGFHDQIDAARVAANLVESVQKFRQGLGPSLPTPTAAGKGAQIAEMTAAEQSLGRDYLQLVADGVIAAQYVAAWQEPTDDAVLLAPAHTFLMMNRPVDYQFWLDIGSRGWFDRLYQPLTHPYVLSRHWQAQHPWDADDEFAASQERLYRLAIGLIRRCRKQIILGLSELGEQGFEQRGQLLWAFNQVLRRLAKNA